MIFPKVFLHLVEGLAIEFDPESLDGATVELLLACTMMVPPIFSPGATGPVVDTCAAPVNITVGPVTEASTSPTAMVAPVGAVNMPP